MALVAFLFLSLSPYIYNIVNADTKTEIENKIRESERKKAQAQNAINQKTAEKSSVEQEKKQLDAEIAVLEDEIYKINQKIAENEEDISRLTAEINEAEAKINEYNQQFQARSIYMYKYGHTSYLSILFGSSSFTDLIRNIQIIKRLTEYDDRVLDEMVAAKQVIVDNKTKIEQVKAANEEQRGLLTSQKSKLDQKLSERQAKIAQLNADIEQARRIADQEEAAMNQLKRQLNSLLSRGSGTAPGGGSLLWPSDSTRTVTSAYGMRYHPIQQRNKMHTGIDIGAAYGTNVLAAEAGKVIMAGWNGGYGKCVVIDHGNGLSTLYGHNSVLLVSTGQTVTRGQVIAQVGSTGNSTGPHIHFEVLVNGQTRDPMAYVN